MVLAVAAFLLTREPCIDLTDGKTGTIYSVFGDGPCLYLAGNSSATMVDTTVAIKCLSFFESLFVLMGYLRLKRRLTYN